MHECVPEQEVMSLTEQISGDCLLTVVFLFLQLQRRCKLMEHATGIEANPNVLGAITARILA